MFFAHNTALGPPYHVLIDTNFINFSIKVLSWSWVCSGPFPVLPDLRRVSIALEQEKDNLGVRPIIAA